MNHEAAFFQAIQETPDDDTPRLVYADWLEETGGEAERDQAEFIRLQCRLARMEPGEPGRAALEAREQRLMRRHRAAWSDSLVPGGFRSEFHRGFPERLCTTLAWFLEHSQELERLGWFRDLRVDNLGTNLETLANSPLLSGCYRVHLFADMGVTRQKWRSFFHSALLSNLVDLTLTNVSVAAIDELLSSDLRLRLRQLTLDGSGGFRALLALCDRLPSLRGLHLYGPVELGALASIFTLSQLTELEELTLRLPQMDASFGQELARAPFLPQLRRLDLSGSQGSPALLSLLERTTSLRWLALVDSETQARSIQALSGFPSLAGLRVLHLSHNKIGIQGMRALIRSPSLSGLTTLTLDSTQLGEFQPRELFTQANWSQLKTLSLANTDFDTDALRSLDSLSYSCLVNLSLAGNRIDIRGARILAASEHLSGLRELDLTDAGLGNASARALSVSPILGGLETLGVNGNSIGRPGREALQTRYGDACVF